MSGSAIERIYQRLTKEDKGLGHGGHKMEWTLEEVSKQQVESPSYLELLKAIEAEAVMARATDKMECVVNLGKLIFLLREKVKRKQVLMKD